MTVDPWPPRSLLIRTLEYRHDRAAPADLVDLAVLRRSMPRLPVEADQRALALVARYCGPTNAAQDAGLLTACLWATRHRGTVPATNSWNLGRALGAAPQEQGRRAWLGLYTATLASLPRRMSTAMQILERNDIATDWDRLHRDLRSWYQGQQRPVLRRWGTGLFGQFPGQSTAQPAVPPPPRTSEVSS